MTRKERGFAFVIIDGSGQNDTAESTKAALDGCRWLAGMGVSEEPGPFSNARV